MQKHQCGPLRLYVLPSSTFSQWYQHSSIRKQPWVKVLSVKVWPGNNPGSELYLVLHNKNLTCWSQAPCCGCTSCLRALRLLRLLCDGAVVLWLVLSQRRVCLCEQGRAIPQGEFQQEPPRCHQLAVALSVWEGVAGATGADTPGGWAARSGSWQSLLPHLMSHLEGGERDKTLM